LEKGSARLLATHALLWARLVRTPVYPPQMRCRFFSSAECKARQKDDAFVSLSPQNSPPALAAAAPALVEAARPDAARPATASRRERAGRACCIVVVLVGRASRSTRDGETRKGQSETAGALSLVSQPALHPILSILFTPRPVRAMSRLPFSFTRFAFYTTHPHTTPSKLGKKKTTNAPDPTLFRIPPLFFFRSHSLFKSSRPRPRPPPGAAVSAGAGRPPGA